MRIFIRRKSQSESVTTYKGRGGDQDKDKWHCSQPHWRWKTLSRVSCPLWEIEPYGRVTRGRGGGYWNRSGWIKSYGAKRFQFLHNNNFLNIQSID